MTRYTNVGRKRSFVESDKELADRQAEKRVKISDEVDGGGQTAGASISPTSEGNEIKNAYQNRDQNRKKHALREVATEKRRIQRQDEKLANTTCFACRQKGHAARSCPNAKADAVGRGKAVAQHGICYRCGSDRHSLSKCRKSENPDNPLPFASCFVCSGKGHIASSCPKNENRGIYPNGGSCKLCRETTHLARNCPSRKQDNTVTLTRLGTGGDAGADEDDFHVFKRINSEIERQEKSESREKRKSDVKVGVVSQKAVRVAPKPVAAKKVVAF